MKHVVITGAADGIGKALTLRYAQAGYAITGIDIDQERALALQRNLDENGVKALFITADLTRQADLEIVVDRLNERPAIDVLVHNAGISAVGHFAQLDLAQQQLVLQLNFKTPLLLTAALLKNNQFGAEATLIFMASLSYFVGYPGAAVYAASKDGLAAYARSLRVGLAGYPLHVLTVFPGPTRTAHARRYSPDNSREQKRMSPETLANHIFEAEQRKQPILIPSLNNKTFALFGKLMPGLAEKVMKRVIFDPLVN